VFLFIRGGQRTDCADYILPTDAKTTITTSTNSSGPTSSIPTWIFAIGAVAMFALGAAFGVIFWKRRSQSNVDKSLSKPKDGGYSGRGEQPWVGLRSTTIDVHEKDLVPSGHGNKVVQAFDLNVSIMPITCSFILFLKRQMKLTMIYVSFFKKGFQSTTWRKSAFCQCFFSHRS
jgi:hypothetical protein